MSKPLASEHDEQCTVIEWARLHERQEPRLALLFAVPNAGAGAQRGQAGKMRGEGAKSGVPDLCLPVVVMPPRQATTQYMIPGLYIEMKRRRAPPSALSVNQRWWIDQLRDQGYHVEVCRGADEAIAALRRYLGMRGD